MCQQPNKTSRKKLKKAPFVSLYFKWSYSSVNRVDKDNSS